MGRTVIFDIGGVYFSDGTRIAIDAIAAKYEIGRDAVAGILNGEPGRKYRTGRISAEQFWKRAIRQWNIQSSAGVLSQLWCSSYQLNEGTVRLVDRLKKASHELLYLSDNTAEKVAYLDAKYAFLEKFDDGIFSHIAKCRKPDPVIYQLLLGKASHPADACIFIDDKPANLEPAKKLGMQVVAFKDSSQLEKQLRALALLAP
jgi:HAD superfamily hydrolase (TIGR01509 family)